MSAPPKTTERRAPRSWMITALLASLAVSYVAFVFGPAQAQITALRGRLNERRQHILQASGLVLPVEQATQQLAKTRLISTHWQADAPNPAELSSCFASLTADPCKLRFVKATGAGGSRAMLRLPPGVCPALGPG